MRADKKPPVIAPEAIEFHGSSFWRKYTSVQSKLENRPPHTANPPPMRGACLRTACTALRSLLHASHANAQAARRQHGIHCEPHRRCKPEATPATVTTMRQRACSIACQRDFRTEPSFGRNVHTAGGLMMLTLCSGLHAVTCVSQCNTRDCNYLPARHKGEQGRSVLRQHCASCRTLGPISTACRHGRCLLLCSPC